VGREFWSVQRRLAEVFEMEDGPLSTLELAARLHEVEANEVTDAQLSSVRRALNALARKGVLVGHREEMAGSRAGRRGRDETRSAPLVGADGRYEATADAANLALKGGIRPSLFSVTTSSALRVKRHPQGDW
jgi:hypothetical protein